MGTDAWFERQLHPERIDDSAFEARMDAFPAMKLSQAELMQRFPGPQKLRQMEQRGIDPATVTADPVERAIYTTAFARYQVARQLI